MSNLKLLRCGRIVHQTTELRRREDVSVLGLRPVLCTPRNRSRARPTGACRGDPLASRHARVTDRLEWRLCALCQIMTQKAPAEILRLPTSTPSNLLHRVITRVRRGHTIRGLTTLHFTRGARRPKYRMFVPVAVGPVVGERGQKLSRCVGGLDGAFRARVLRHKPDFLTGDRPVPVLRDGRAYRPA